MSVKPLPAAPLPDASPEAEGDSEPSTPEDPARATPSTLDELLRDTEMAAAAAPPAVEAPQQLTPGAASVPGLRTARVLAVDGKKAKIAWRGSAHGVDAVVAPEVESDLVAQAAKRRDAVLVECSEGELPLIVGIVQTRVASDVELRGETISLHAAREVVLRAGKSALRLREDGDIEIIGGRISAVSRGLFRLVGRALRLN